jgi:hypothetical protein
MTSPDQSTMRNEILSSLPAEDFGLLSWTLRIFGIPVVVPSH